MDKPEDEDESWEDHAIYRDSEMEQKENGERAENCWNTYRLTYRLN